MSFVQGYLIALGGNLPSVAGSPELTLRAALGRLADHGAQVQAISPFYRTPCFPPGAGPDYVNAAAMLRHDKAPGAFLDVLHQIEAEFGRARVQRWGRRTLDLDLVAAGDAVLPDRPGFETWCRLPTERQIETTPDHLVLPHPRIQDRAFVLVPLSDIAPDWVHPVLGQSVAQMLSALPEENRAEIVPIPG